MTLTIYLRISYFYYRHKCIALCTKPLTGLRGKKKHLMAAVMMVKYSKTLFIIKTKQQSERQRQRQQSGRTWKVFFCRIVTFTKRHSTERTKTDRWKGWENGSVKSAEKKKKKEEREKGGQEWGQQSASRIDRFTPPPLPPPPPHLTLCLEALKHKSLWERVERQPFNQILIQCKAGVAPLLTFNHKSLSLLTCSVQRDTYMKTDTQHSYAVIKTVCPQAPRLAYSRCLFSSWGDRWARCSWTLSPQRWQISGGYTLFRQPGCTPSPWEGHSVGVCALRSQPHHCF